MPDVSKRKSKTKTTESATRTPIVPGYIQGPVSDYFGQVGGLLGSQGPSASAYAPNASQTMAFDRARSMGANAGAGQGMDALRGLLDFSPASVQAGQVKDADLSGYMNPHEDSVVNSALGDIERFRGMGINNNASSATLAGSRGGSRQGVSDALTNEAALREAGATAGRLRQAGFANAQQMAMGDIDRRFGADTFNSQQGLAGANFRAGIGRDLLNGGMAIDANERANIGLLSQMGDQERQMALQQDPAMRRAMWLSQLQGLLGMNPAALLGQQSDGTSTTRGSESGVSVGFEWGPFSVGG